MSKLHSCAESALNAATDAVTTRRSFVAGAAALAVAGFATSAEAAKTNFNLRGSSVGAKKKRTTRQKTRTRKTQRAAASGPPVPRIYGPIRSERFPIPALGRGVLPKKYWRTVVNDPTGERPGTVVVDTPGHYLYLVLPGGKAMRYGVGVGKAGFEWQGRAEIAWKRKWPTWTPPASMIRREPKLAKYRKGMRPGLRNPLGARALYIHENGRDTLYRVHGTNAPRSIGHSRSSGCIRMINQDVIDLYKRVRTPTTIVVRQGSRPLV